MTDTPGHIKTLQLKIWLSKPPQERLRQMMKDNDMLYKFRSKTNISKSLNKVVKKGKDSEAEN
jgi:hypothetical protein